MARTLFLFGVKSSGIVLHTLAAAEILFNCFRLIALTCTLLLPLSTRRFLLK